ncbi:MAG: hypothetical protein ACRCYO_08690 [Bacteroidia bacterium]
MPLRLDRLRTFGDVFSDSMKFIRQNFSAFFKTVLFIVGPFLVLSCAASMYFQIEALDLDPFERVNRFGSLLAKSALIDRSAWLFNGLVTAVVISHFFKVYKQKGSGKFTVSDVVSSIFNDFFNTAVTFLVVAFLTVAFGALVFVIIFGMASSANVGGSIFLVLGGGIGYLILAYPVWYWMFSVFFVRSMDEDIGIFSALLYAQRLISGQFWKTWAIFFCFWLLLFVVAMCISIPSSIASGLAGIWSDRDYFDDTDSYRTMQLVFSSIALFGRAMVYSSFMVPVAMHFFALRESEEGDGMRKQIEEIGKRHAEEERIELMY